ncbi:polyprenyl synthetase family protein [Isosphaeraceae bacterium EP7]
MPELASSATCSASAEVSPARDRERVDRYLTAFLAQTGRKYASNPHVRPLYEAASEFVVRGGKRLRPRLCLASYRILQGGSEPPPRPVWLCAASLEILHAFMLVHDDLIDASLLRRDRATLHEDLRLRSSTPECPTTRKSAADLALISGDLLCSLGLRLIARSGLDDSRLGRVHRLVADMMLETGLGEALDVLYGNCPLDTLDEEHVVEAYLRKTARYSVSGPLVLGAVLAGAPSSVCRALDKFGDLLGFGYQVRNDLEGLEADETSGDHADLDSGKRTYVLMRAYRASTERGRRAIEDALEAPAGVLRRHRLLALIRNSGAIESSRDTLMNLQREAVEALRASSIEPAQRRSFVALMDLFGFPTPPQATPASVIGEPCPVTVT